MSDSERPAPREVAELLKLQMDILEPEQAERLAEREIERIEYEAERLSNPYKWHSDRERPGGDGA